MSKYKCPCCGKKMVRVGTHKIDDIITKVGVVCNDHPGITYWMLEAPSMQQILEENKVGLSS
jgi:hypothetical protein